MKTEILNMTNEAENTYSFWQLINRFKIEIPIIQRDYAQGREDDKAASIREQIIQDIVSTLSDGGTPLSFYFVYGRVADGVFVPIDGQQRLTTLWLLHLYLFKRCFARQGESCKKDCPHSILSRFTYATRQSSREFCEAVVAKDILSKIDEYQNNGEINPVEQCVKDQPWFYPDWAVDPTVTGMLRTLDHLHNKLKDNDDQPELLNNLLKDNCPITFLFLDMEEHDLTDDLYLNMNARGLPLTEFENFKASIEKYLVKHRSAIKVIVDSLKPIKFKDNETWDKMSGDTPEKIITWKLEHDWHDVFWDAVTHDPIKTELQMLSMFRRHFLNVWSLNNKDDDDIRKALTPPVNGFSFTPFSVYEKVLNIVDHEKALATIVNLFEALAHHGKQITDTHPVWSEKEAWSPLEGKWENGQETFASRARLFAVMKCFEMPVPSADMFKSSYAEWMRVVWNILENTNVDAGNYHSALAMIDMLGANWNAILLFFRETTLETLKDKLGLTGDQMLLAQDQVQEEREKAAIIAEFRETIICAETIFKGAVRFLYRDEDETLDWATFKLKTEHAAQYFTSEGLIADKAVAFVTALILVLPEWIDNETYLFRKDLSAWKRLLLAKKFCKASHKLFIENQLPSEVDPQTSVKRQLLGDGVVDYLLKYYANARFKWSNYWFRLYAPNQRRHEHILFDIGNYRRNETLVCCLKDFGLQTENTRIGSSQLFIGETITIKSSENHLWRNNLWKKWWWNGQDTNPYRGCLVFDHEEYGVKYAVDVYPESTDDGNRYSVSVFRRDGKTTDDEWIKALSMSLDESTGRYCLKNQSAKDTLTCVHEIINHPFK